MQITSVINKDSENWSFTGVLSIWVLLSLIGESIIYILVELTLPFSKPGYSYLQMLILRILFLSAFPIGMIGLVTPFLPYQKIDYSRSAIIKSLEHKLLFLCTSPFLYIGYLIANNVGSLTDSLIKPGFGFFSTGLSLWTVAFIWIFFSLWCWELFLGKNTSITLRNLRMERKNNLIDSSSNISHVSYHSRNEKGHKSLFGKVSLRVTSLMCGLPILLIMVGVNLDPNGGFVFGLFISISSNAFACFFSLLTFKNYLSEQGHSFDFINQINNHLFGNNDIDSHFMIIGFFLLFLIFMFVLSFHHFIPKEIVILIYLLLVLIFISILWSNQLKSFFHHL